MNLLPPLTFITGHENAGAKETKIVRSDILRNSPRLSKGFQNVPLKLGSASFASFYSGNGVVQTQRARK